MAVNRTVLPNGTVQPQHNTPYETDVDANLALADQWQGGRMMEDLGMSGIANGLRLSTSATLTPGVTSGVLYAQGRRVPFNTAPSIPAAPANGANYLYYNSASGWYYQVSAVAAASGDALVGHVTTSGSAVTGVTPATPLYGCVPAAPSVPGNFTLQHFLGRKPVHVHIQMTSSGAIWFQSPLDVDQVNLYLVASDFEVTAKVQIW